jgi:hypothetical protein
MFFLSPSKEMTACFQILSNSSVTRRCIITILTNNQLFRAVNILHWRVRIEVHLLGMLCQPFLKQHFHFLIDVMLHSYAILS